MPYLSVITMVITVFLVVVLVDNLANSKPTNYWEAAWFSILLTFHIFFWLVFYKGGS